MDAPRHLLTSSSTNPPFPPDPTRHTPLPVPSPSPHRHRSRAQRHRLTSRRRPSPSLPTDGTPHLPPLFPPSLPTHGSPSQTALRCHVDLPSLNLARQPPTPSSGGLQYECQLRSPGSRQRPLVAVVPSSPRADSGGGCRLVVPSRR